MLKWKLLLALTAVFGLVYGSSIVKTLPSMDIVVTFRIDDLQKMAEGIAYVMLHLKRLASREPQIRVCCIWSKGNFLYEYPLPANVSATKIWENLTDFLRSPSSTGRLCGRRNFTHYGEVVVKTIARQGEGMDKWIIRVGSEAEDEAKKRTALAIVFLDDYHFDEKKVDEIWIVVHSSDPIIRSAHSAGSWSAAAAFVVGAIWNESHSIVRECKYSATNESCYFSREQRDHCLREERVEPFRKEQWSPAAQNFCYGMPFAQNVSCKLLSCHDTCRAILENMSCPCGGIWNQTVPNRFKYCRITSTMCVGEPCPSPSSVSVGAVLMITGGVMFVSSGIGLIIFLLACVKMGKTSEGGTKSKFKRRS